MSFPPTTIGSNSNQTRERRRSFLDYGGPNSLNNFASSYKRAQSYSGSDYLERPFVEDSISPNTSPALEAGEQADVAESDGELGPLSRGYNHISTFEFPHDEESPLLSDTGSIKLPGSLGGNSTSPQTVFNSINTLMGIGMLSLPFGFKLSGWVFGCIMLLSSALITNYTAKILGRLLKRHPNLHSYGDLAKLYGGNSVQVIVTLIFSIDLLGATLSLIILFSDSFRILLPHISEFTFKLAIVSTILILSFAPLSILSIFSLLGIICTTLLLILIVICGLLTSNGPGSLLAPEVTNLWPAEYKYLLLSLGIYLAPWGGHPVFPELYRDMRHPSKFNSCSNITFFITYDLDFLISVVGYLMFGQKCQDSITKNLMTNENYPDWVRPLISVFMGLLPISKLPLIVRPLITVYEKIFNIYNINMITVSNGKRQEIYGFKRIISRLLFCSMLLALSLLFTSFGRIVSFLGSAICFTICITLPLLFYLKIAKDDISTFQKFFIRCGILIAFICSVIGTYGSIAIDGNI